MTDNERSTHFQGFAHLLDEEIEAALENMAEFSFVPNVISDDIKQIIARRAFDLVAHACSRLGGAEYALRYWPEEQVIDEYIPDLTQWPDSPTAE